MTSSTKPAPAAVAPTKLWPAPEPSWLQHHLLLADPVDGNRAEQFAATHLLPALTALEQAGVVTSWNFLRKGDRWRLRYHPPSSRGAEAATAAVIVLLDHGQRSGVLADWRPVVYEPEALAFGGDAGMEAAHQHFHADSHHTLNYLGAVHSGERPDQRRELAVLLAAALMRGAALDWHEQGDTWAKLAELRGAQRPTSPTLRASVHRLLTVDTAPGSRLATGQLSYAAAWFNSFTFTGARLRELNDDGQLRRGLRAVTAHLLIFHFNRLGLSAAEQALLANAATTVALDLE
ncbi:thiopeptide-type bacteriocin biosynthesis protein (plasmid) [Kitasatospora sp. NBC_00070]|uniref:thiopeptide-type bacteriocin biosynthesis protein n=1 Tax=Kitasatospora sp. NBC_00070 TaxID=2975962 RepID=UPI002F90EDDB